MSDYPRVEDGIAECRRELSAGRLSHEFAILRLWVRYGMDLDDARAVITEVLKEKADG